MKCSICEQEFSDFPNNPLPFKGNYCCGECDDRFVTPARAFGIHDEESIKALQKIAKLGAQLVKDKKEFKRVLDGSNSRNS